MSRLNAISEEELKIHYFLLNNGFEHFKAESIDNGDGSFEITTPTYVKEDLIISYHSYGRIFEIRKSGDIIFKIDNNKDNEIVNTTITGDIEFSKNWTVVSLGDEVTLEDIMPFFREDKLKDLFKNG